MSAGAPPAQCVQVTTTVATRDDAERLAGALVSERLAACVQVQGPIRSTYRWRGAVETAEEWYCHAKTTAARLPALQARLAELHPYDIPEIIAVPIVAGHGPYLEWIAAETEREA
jgi:periplasmic divalent cation tolerance protein